MQYPLISEYIEAILSAEDNFNELSDLRPVLNENGRPVMSSGNFAVVFKMNDGEKNYAIKCFTKEQKGREDAYKLINKELDAKKGEDSYLVPFDYLDNELYVDTKQSTDNEFPVLKMDWVEGVPLDEYVNSHLEDEYALKQVTDNFKKLICWLLPQSFAHGDLKPEIFSSKKICRSLWSIMTECMFLKWLVSRPGKSEVPCTNIHHAQLMILIVILMTMQLLKSC